MHYTDCTETLQYNTPLILHTVHSSIYTAQIASDSIRSSYPCTPQGGNKTKVTFMLVAIVMVWKCGAKGRWLPARAKCGLISKSVTAVCHVFSPTFLNASVLYV